MWSSGANPFGICSIQWWNAGQSKLPHPQMGKYPRKRTAAHAIYCGSAAAPRWHPKDARGLVAPARRRSGATAIRGIGRSYIAKQLNDS